MAAPPDGPACKAVATNHRPGGPVPVAPNPWADGPLAGYAEAMTEAAAALAATHAATSDTP